MYINGAWLKTYNVLEVINPANSTSLIETFIRKRRNRQEIERTKFITPLNIN